MKWPLALQDLWLQQSPKSAPLHLSKSRAFSQLGLKFYAKLKPNTKAGILLAMVALVWLGAFGLGLYWQQQSFWLRSEVAALRWQRDNQQQLSQAPETLVQLRSWFAASSSSASANSRLNMLLDRAKSSGLRVVDGEILRAAEHDLGTEHWLRLGILGSFHDTADFLSAINSDQNLVFIESMLLQSQDTDLELILLLRYLQTN